jgi:hypothetical protein
LCERGMEECEQSEQGDGGSDLLHERGILCECVVES